MDIVRTLWKMTEPSKPIKPPKPPSDEKLNEVKAALDEWVREINSTDEVKINIKEKGNETRVHS